MNPQVTTFTPAELTGDFSHAVDGGPDPGVASFLQAHPYFQPNPQLAALAIIDPSKINPVTQGYISNNLIPTSPSGTLTPNGASLDNRDEFTIKTDFNITSADRLSITLVRFHNPYSYPFVQNGAPNVAGFPGNDRFDNYFGDVAYTKVISPTLVNEFHFTAQRDYNSLNNPALKLPTPAALGIKVTPDDPTGPSQMLLYASNLQLGFNINGPAYFADTTYGYQDSVTWNHGKHTWKAGASLTYIQNNAFFAFATNGAFAFDGPAGIGSGSDLADFLLGVPDYYYQYPGAFSAVRSYQFGGYLQDEWKVRPNFTLTLGVRYEYSSPKHDPQNRNYMIIPGRQSTEYPNAPLGLLFPGDPGAPSSGVNFPDRNDWAPRIGFAWDPFGKGKTSIRGGFGVFYDVLLAQDNQNQNGTPPFYSAAFVPFDPSQIPANGPATFLSDPFGTTGITNPFPSRPIQKNIDFGAAGFLPFGPASVFIQPNMRTPYTLQYNFSVQQQIANGLGFEIGYVGSQSRKLIAQEDIDPFIIGTTTRILNTQPGLQIPDAYGQMPYTFGNRTNANYNGMVASLTKRTGDLRGIGQAFLHRILHLVAQPERRRRVHPQQQQRLLLQPERDLRFGRLRHSPAFRLQRGLAIAFRQAMVQRPQAADSRMAPGSDLHRSVRLAMGRQRGVISRRGHTRTVRRRRPKPGTAKLVRRGRPESGSSRDADIHRQRNAVDRPLLLQSQRLVPARLLLQFATARDAGRVSNRDLRQFRPQCLPRSRLDQFRSGAGETHQSDRASATELPGGIFQRAESHGMGNAYYNAVHRFAALGPDYVHLQSAHRPTRPPACILVWPAADSLLGREIS